MMSHRLWLLCAALLLTTACSHRIGDLTMASTKNINLQTGLHKIGPRRIVGEDVAQIIVLFPTKVAPNLEEAMDNAIEKAPGAVGLADVTIKRHFWYIPLIYGKDTIEVEGNPIYRADRH